MFSLFLFSSPSCVDWGVRVCVPHSEREKKANEDMSEDSDADEESEAEEGKRPNLGVPGSFVKGTNPATSRT